MSNISIGNMTLGIYQTNCYFVYREDSDKVLVFDPADHGKKIEAALGHHGLHTVAIFLTHGHFDHIGGCAELKAAADAYAGEHGWEPVKIYAGEAEKDFLRDTKSNLSKDMGRPVTVTADVYLQDGEELNLDGIRIKVLATPGHTAGSEMCIRDRTYRGRCQLLFPGGRVLNLRGYPVPGIRGQNRFPHRQYEYTGTLGEGEAVYSA